MDKVFAVFLLVFAVAMLVSVEIYIKMYRRSCLALVLLHNMEEGLQYWLSIADNLFVSGIISEQVCERFNALLSSYRGIQKKQAYQKVSIINQIHALAASVIAENIANPEIIDLGHKLSIAFSEFSDLQTEYNSRVFKLNSALDGKISGVVGRAFRLKPLEKLKDLSVL